MGFVHAHAGPGDAERDWGIAVETHVGQTLRHGVADDLVVVGVAGLDRADDRHGVDVVAACQAVGRQRGVVRAGDVERLHDLGAEFVGGLAGPFLHRLGDLAVELRDHQSEPYHMPAIATGP